MPTTDGGTSGGAIDTARKIEMVEMTSSQQLNVASTDAGDTTRTFTIIGRNTAGAIVTEGPTSLNGTTNVLTSNTFERHLRTTVSATHGTATVNFKQSSNGAVVSNLITSITSAIRMFHDGSSSTSQIIYYEKIFWKNTNATLTLNNAVMRLTSNPVSKVKLACAPSVGDNASVANRLTVPSGGLTFVDQNSSSIVPGSVLSAGSAIGVWIQLTLAIGDAALKSSFQSQLSGTTIA